MSNYTKQTRHPETREWIYANWIDDYFGVHRYGVQFEGEKRVWEADARSWETRDNPPTYKEKKEQVAERIGSLVASEIEREREEKAGILRRDGGREMAINGTVSSILDDLEIYKDPQDTL